MYNESNSLTSRHNLRQDDMLLKSNNQSKPHDYP